MLNLITGYPKTQLILHTASSRWYIYIGGNNDEFKFIKQSTPLRTMAKLGL